MESKRENNYLINILILYFANNLQEKKSFYCILFNNGGYNWSTKKGGKNEKYKLTGP